MTDYNCTFLYSQDKLVSCRIDNKLLHSRHGGSEEALRIFTAQNKNDSSYEAKLIILLGASLHYDVEALQSLYPNASILGIYFHKDLYDRSKADISLLYDDTSTQNFPQLLLSVLKKTNVQSGIRVQIWPVSTQIWKKRTQSCLECIQNCVQLYLAEQKTQKTFLSQWLRNAFFHFLHLHSYQEIQQGSMPVVLASAGPSLNHFLSQLLQERDSYYLVAVSSALRCLNDAGLEPDLVVHQDASYYAQRHLFFDYKSKNTRISMPLSAGRVSSVHMQSPVLINTGQEAEQVLQLDCGVKIPEYATVLGTAIELSYKLSDARIYLVGADLSMDSYTSHCSPHSSDQSTSRLKTNLSKNYQTYYSASKKLSGHIRYGQALKQDNALQSYAQWLLHWDSPIKERLVQLVPENESSQIGLPCENTLACEKSISLRPSFVTRSLGSISERKKNFQRLVLEPCKIIKEKDTTFSNSKVLRKIRQELGDVAWNKLIQYGENLLA